MISKSIYKADTAFVNSLWNESEKEWQTIGVITRHLLKYNMAKVDTYTKLLSRPIPSTSELTVAPQTFTKVTVSETTMSSI